MSWSLSYIIGAFLLGGVLTSRVHGYLRELYNDTVARDDVVNNVEFEFVEFQGDESIPPAPAPAPVPTPIPQSNLPTTMACSLAWFLWDIIFYSNKLHQDKFVSTLTTGGSFGARLVISHNIALLALLGSFSGAWLVGREDFGAKKLQVWGGAAVAFLFLILFCISSSVSPFFQRTSQLIFVVLSFVGQWVNVSTFVIPAVSFDGDFRTIGHGISAASGKVGALVGVWLMGEVLHVRQGEFGLGEERDEGGNEKGGPSL